MLSKAPFEWNRRGGAAGLGGDPPGRGPGDEDDDPEDGEDSASLPRGVGPKKRADHGGSDDPHWSDTDGSSARTSEVKACSSVGGAIRNDPSLRSVL